MPKVSKNTICPFRATITLAPAIFSLSTRACTAGLIRASFSADIPTASGRRRADCRREPGRKDQDKVLRRTISTASLLFYRCLFCQQVSFKVLPSLYKISHVFVVWIHCLNKMPSSLSGSEHSRFCFQELQVIGCLFFLKPVNFCVAIGKCQ